MTHTIQNNKISDFKNASSILSNDLFLISKEQEHSTYTSYSISANLIYESHKTKFENTDMNPIGEWFFTDASEIQCETHSSLSSAVNKEYFIDNFRNKLHQLSAQLYNKNNDLLKLPSYVGMVIVSDALNNEDKVKKIYGGKTWKPIEGRFLFATGENESNDDITYGDLGFGEIDITKSEKTGGCKDVLLTAKNLPGHSHCFKNCNFGKFPFGSITVHAGLESESSFGVIPKAANDHTGGVIMKHQTMRKHKKWSGRRTTDKGMYAKPSSVITVGELVGELEPFIKTYTFTAKGTIDEFESKNNPHTNLPPYIGKYIWERTE